MKHSLTSFAAFMLMAGVANAQITFERHYGTPSALDAFTCMTHANDGGYLLAGTTANFGSDGLDILLVKTDEQGNTVWTKTWGGAGNDGAFALVNAQGGNGYLMAGYTAENNDDRNLLALRIDDNGEELWHITRGSSGYYSGTHALTLSNGDFLVTGSISSTPLPGPDVIAIRVTDDGTVVWDQTYGIGGTPQGAVETSDGGFLLAMSSGSLLKFSGQGVFMWQKTLVLPGNISVIASIEFIKRTPTGKITVGGGNNATALPFFVIIDESGNLVSNFEIQQNNLMFNGLRLDDASQLSNGQYVLMFRDFFAQTAVPFLKGVVLFDPVADTVLWHHTYEELNLADIRQPGQLLKTKTGDDFLLTGSTYSDEEGENAVLSKFSNTGTPQWRQNFGVSVLGDHESGRKVLQTPDGGYLVLANKIVSGNSYDMWLIKTDANGSVQWDVAYGFPDADDIIGVDATPDGGYIAAAYNGPTIRVLKINGSGQLQWLKKFNPGLADGTFGIRVSAANECLMVFPAVEPVTSTFGSALMKLNAQGDSAWIKYYFELEAGYINPYLYGLAFASDNHYALCGGVETPGGNLWPVIATTDSTGNLLWTKTYDPDEDLAILIDINTTNGNDYITHGIGIGDAPGLRPYVIRTDENGTLIWASKPDDPLASSIFPWTSAHEPGTGHTFLFEQKSLTQAGSVGAVHQLDANGQVICEGNFGLGHAASFRGGAVTSDGGSIAVGTATFDNSTDAWLVKMNMDCTLGFASPLLPPFGLNISPNPSSGLFAVEIESEHTGAVNIEVVNASGEIVMQWHGDKNTEKLRQNFDLSLAADGVFFIWVQIGNQARALSWIKSH